MGAPHRGKAARSMQRAAWVFGLVVATLAVCCTASQVGAQPTISEDDAIVLARRLVKAKRNATLAGGAVVVNEAGGLAILHRTFEGLAGTTVIGDEIRVRFGPLEGPRLWDLFANSIDDPKASLQVAGTQGSVSTFPVLPYPTPVTVTPGTGVLLIKRTDGPVSLPPGDYGTIRLQRGAVVLFEGGTYNVESLRSGFQTAVLFNGPTTVNVLEKARFGKRVIFGPNPDVPTFDPCSIQLHTASSRTVRFGVGALVRAKVFAPEARIFLAVDGLYEARLVGDSVVIGPDVVLQPLEPSPACE